MKKEMRKWSKKVPRTASTGNDNQSCHHRVKIVGSHHRIDAKFKPYREGNVVFTIPTLKFPKYKQVKALKPKVIRKKVTFLQSPSPSCVNNNKEIKLFINGNLRQSEIDSRRCVFLSY
jgi:hypothetical protein